MLKLNKGAITGGLSCGKSSVCRIFKELGAYVVSADEIVHQLLSPDTNLGQSVIQLIGSDIVVDETIDRSKIAKKVFSNPKLLQSLENLLHPAVQKEIERQYQQNIKESVPRLFLAEIPLLFETKGEKCYGFTIAVVSDPELSMERFKAATGYDKEEFKKRMARQMDPEEKARRADYVIRNDGTMAELREQVTKIYDQLVNN